MDSISNRMGVKQYFIDNIFSDSLLLQITFILLTFVVIIFSVSSSKSIVEKYTFGLSSDWHEVKDIVLKYFYRMLYGLCIINLIDFILFVIGDKINFLYALRNTSIFVFCFEMTNVVILGVFIILALRIIFNKLIYYKRLQGDHVSATYIGIVAKIVQIFIAFLLIISVLSVEGSGLQNVAAAGGIGGIILGLSVKDMFTNVFGVITIALERPFIVGDRIRVLNSSIGNLEGIVSSIGWRATKVISISDRSTISVPNSMFMGSAFENKTNRDGRRLDEVYYIKYDGNMESISEIMGDLRDYILSYEGIANDKNRTEVYIVEATSEYFCFKVLSILEVNSFALLNEARRKILLKLSDIIEKYNYKMTSKMELGIVAMLNEQKK